MTVLVLMRRHLLSAQSRRMLFAFWGLFVLTLSVAGVSAYQILMMGLPALTGIRTVARVVFVLLLPFAYLTAAGMEWLFSKGRGLIGRRVATSIVLAAYLAFGWETGVGVATVDKRYAQDRVSALEKDGPIRERQAKVSETGPILAALWLDKSASAQDTQLDAMLAAQDLNIVTVNGYSRFLAPGFRYVSDCQSLADMLVEYQSSLPYFSPEQVAKRLVIAPAGVTCKGQFESHRSRSAGRLPDDAYSALIAPKCLSCPTAPGSTLKLLVWVTNLSGRSWPQDGISLSTRFVRANDGTALSGFDNRFPIGTDFAPHESKQYVIELKSPAQAGDYRLEADLVQEMVTWFSQKGTKRGELSIRVDAAEPKSISPSAQEVCGSAEFIGFYPPEQWGRWSSSPVAEVRFAKSVRGNLTIQMLAKKLGSSDGESLTVRVGGDSRMVQLSGDMKPLKLAYHLLGPADEIEFRGITPRSPQSLSLGPDPRPMAVAIADLECRVP